MRKVQGTLVFSYCPGQPQIILEGHADVYRFDDGLVFDGSIESGAMVTLTLITEPANSGLSSLPVKLKLAG